jgi:hypothetical protein
MLMKRGRESNVELTEEAGKTWKPAREATN